MTTLRTAMIVSLALACNLRLHAQESFRFVYIAELRVASRQAQSLQRLIANVNAIQPIPAFVVASGLTDSGRTEEFDRFQSLSAVLSPPLYATPSVHDVCWSPTGKEAFIQARKKTYQSWDYSGCHFIALDSTMLLHPLGHFDGTQLKWLESDLKKVKKATPVFLFFHHGIGHADSQVDNAEDLLRIIAPYNIAAMFFGDGAKDQQWKINGIQCYRSRGLEAGSYQIVEVGSKEVRVSSARLEDAGKPPTLFAANPVDTHARLRIAFGWDDPNIPLLARRQFLAELQNDKGPIEDNGMKAEYFIDSGSSRPMIPDERVLPDERRRRGTRFMGRFETKGMGIGSHLLRIRITSPNGVAFEREETFSVELLTGQPKQAWSFQAGEGIQSSAAIDGSTVFVASLDGRVYALEIREGKKRWTSTKCGPIVASPVFDSGMVYAASTDHFLYAFDSQSGAMKWKFDSGTPLFVTPAVADGTVCIGANRKIFGVDSATGKQKWVRDAGSFFRSRAVADNGAFYLSGSDCTLYAVDAASGAARWKSDLNGDQSGDAAHSVSGSTSSPAVGPGRIYSYSRDGRICAVNPRTGEIEWRVSLPPIGDSTGCLSQIHANGKIYAAGAGPDGGIYAVDARTGSLTWKSSTGHENSGALAAIENGVLAVTSARGTISFIDAATGKVKMQYTLAPGHCLAAPALAGKLAVVPSMNGTVTAIALP